MYDLVGQSCRASRTSDVRAAESATELTALGSSTLRRLAWIHQKGRASSWTYSAVEKRKKGEVLRKASTDGRAARTRAPSLAMLS